MIKILKYLKELVYKIENEEKLTEKYSFQKYHSNR